MINYSKINYSNISKNIIKYTIFYTNDYKPNDCKPNDYKQNDYKVYNTGKRILMIKNNHFNKNKNIKAKRHKFNYQKRKNRF